MTAVATILAFHAHPDDEVLFAGGTLARLAAEGHRVVIVVACAGGLGAGVNANPETRLAELRESASRLGAARVAHLGYADSGTDPCCSLTRQVRCGSPAPTWTRRRPGWPP